MRTRQKVQESFRRKPVLPMLVCLALGLTAPLLAEPALPFSWGFNEYGQAGDGSTAIRRSPGPVSGLGPIRTLAAGSSMEHSLAVRVDGTVAAWGRNDAGQLGDGTTTHRLTPVPVAALTGIQAVAGGLAHSLALGEDGTVWAWGDNTYGTLGDGTTDPRLTPGQVHGLSGARAISAGFSHNLALRFDGTVWAWGRNVWGELGDGTTVQRSEPVLVSGISGVVAIAAGTFHSLALQSDGTVWAWGYNGYGELGDGTTTNRSVPVQVAGLTGVRAIAAGESFSLALQDHGAVWAWGNNDFGELGAGGLTNSTTPRQIAGLHEIVAIAAGGNHGLALRFDGRLWAWGLNGFGQLGQGVLSSPSLPVLVPGLLNVVGLAAGRLHSFALQGSAPPPSPATANPDAAATLEDALLILASADLLANDVHAEDLPLVVSRVAATSATQGSVSLGGGGAIYTPAPDFNGTASFDYFVSDGRGGFAGSTATVTVAPVNDPPTFDAIPAQTVNEGSPPWDVVVQGVSPGPSDEAAQSLSFHAVSSDPALLPDPVLTGTGDTCTLTFQPAPGRSGVALVTVTAEDGQAQNATFARTFKVHVLPIAGTARTWSWGYNDSGQLGDGTLFDRPATVQVLGLGRTRAVAPGLRHTLALDADGAVWAWGSNAHGQIGSGTAVERPAPVRLDGLGTGILAVAAGEEHSLALRADGTVRAWGNNGTGQLGDGTTTDRTSPVPVSGLSDVIAIAAGGHHSLALTSDGSVWQWGLLFPSSLQLTPQRLSGLSHIVAIADGSRHSLALADDGTVWAWGFNINGQLGDGTTTDRAAPLPVSGVTGAVAVAAAGWQSLALLADGTVRSWGDNSDGQLGDGTTIDRLLPVPVTGLTRVTAIAASGSHALAAKSDGTVWAWGHNLYRELGDGSEVQRATPVQIVGLTRTCGIAAGFVRSFVCAEDPLSHAPTAVPDARASTEDTPLSFPAGELTANDSDPEDDPLSVVRVAATAETYGTVSLAAGTVTYSPDADFNGTARFESTITDGRGGYAAASVDVTVAPVNDPPRFDPIPDQIADQDGAPESLTLTGVAPGPPDESGQTVSVTATSSDPSLLPDPIVSGTGGARLLTWQPALGRTGTATVTVTADDGQPSNSSFVRSFEIRVRTALANVRAWGYNTFGELGDGTSEHRPAPVLVSGIQGMRSVAAGGLHSLAVHANGSVWAWGSNDYGQVGDGTTTRRYTPVRVPGLSRVISVSAGNNSSLALKSDGTVWAWGNNGAGELGDGTVTHRLSPVQTLGLSGVAAIDAGSLHSLALRSDGTVWAWGFNSFGQLGDGTTQIRAVPFRVQGLPPIAAVAGGDEHSLALEVDGTVWAWGDNRRGQLGDGTTTGRLTPVQVPGLTGVVAISAGLDHSLALRSDGTVWAWGINSGGQLGPDRLTPVQVTGLPAVRRIDAGGNHDLALAADGTVWAWGLNNFGQLGDGTTTDRAQPASVAGLSGVRSIAAGTVHNLATLPEEPDTTPPVLVAIDFAPEAIDTSAAGQTVTVTARATDDLSGFAGGQVAFYGPGQPLTGVFSLTSGTAEDGMLQATVTFPRFTAAGIWKIGYVVLSDALAHRREYLGEPFGRSDLDGFGLPELAVTSASDTVAPQLLSIDFEPKAIDTSGGARTVTVTAHATDDLSGFAGGQVTFYGPGGPLTGVFSLVAGTAEDGTLQATVTFPQLTAAGLWKIGYVSLSDAVTNRHEYLGTPFDRADLDGFGLADLLLAPFTVIHFFDQAEGGTPAGELCNGPDGTLYGARTRELFRLAPDGSGFAVLRTLDHDTDGDQANRLLFGRDGLLYGTAQTGGPQGGGTVFRIAPDGSGFTILHAFSSAAGGRVPATGLMQTPDGLLYGTTLDSDAGGGILFRIAPDGSGFTVLRDLDRALDGGQPFGELLLAADGWIYGTTESRSETQGGTLFRISRDGSGFTVLHTFDLAVAGPPDAGVIQGNDGLLYGTLAEGAGRSAIYRIATDGGGFTTLATIETGLEFPLIQGAGGYLYGVSQDLGEEGFGFLFRLRTDGSDFTVLHSFAWDPTGYGASGVLQGPDGYLYGTTASGPHEGSVYRLPVCAAGAPDCDGDEVIDFRPAVDDTNGNGFHDGAKEADGSARTPEPGDDCNGRFNPDQLDLDGDGVGDACDRAPGQWDPSNLATSSTDAATIIVPEATTTLTTPDGGASAVLPPGSTDAPLSLTLVKLPGDFQVVDGFLVLASYDFRIGSGATYPFPDGHFATVHFTVPATATTDQAYADQTLVIASREDDTFVPIPSCAGGGTTSDGRCTEVVALDSTGDGAADAYRLSAPVPHFSIYAAVVQPGAEPPAGFDFYTLPPCRILDTRTDSSPLVSGTIRTFQITGGCGVPPSAKAVSVNVTTVSPTGNGYINLYPTGVSPPATSLLNFAAGQNRANNGILDLAPDGSGTADARAEVFAQGTKQVDVVVDVNGYFQ